MRRWIEPPDISVSNELISLAGGSLLVAKELVRRGFSDIASARAFIDPDFYLPSRPQELPDMDLAVDRLDVALRRGEKMLVWGDFDVDGQTSTAILVDTLRDLGGDVSYHIPIRAQESHGIGLAVLKKIMDDPAGAPNLILTCDTGISAFDALEYAMGRKVDVIVTDHHEIPRQADGVCRLPSAFCIVTPRKLPAGHPLENLPGSGVAYKLAEGLFQRFGEAAQAEKHLDLAALGIVADVAWQTGDARYLLQRGLKLLNSNRRVGLAAIFERAGLSLGDITEEQVGFMIAPRLNALGRLSDANPAVELLTTTDIGLARRFALELEGWNVRRQLLTSQVLRGVMAKLEQDRSFQDSPLLLIAHEGWEAGVIGIVASRLVEMYGKPAVLISIGPDGIGRGSARSVEGIDITRAISEQSGLLLGHGGHQMAAGFSLIQENISSFRHGLEHSIADQFPGKPELKKALSIAAFVKWGELNQEMAQSIGQLAPFGPGNPPIILATDNLMVKSTSTFGRQQEHLRLTVGDENGLTRNVIWWGGVGSVVNERLQTGKVRLAYTLRLSSLRGTPELSLILEDIEKTDISISLENRSGVEILDFRRCKTPFAELLNILQKPDCGSFQIWVEGEQRERLQTEISAKLPHNPRVLRGRDELMENGTLVIWTLPPGRRELEQVLLKSKPARVVLFSNSTGTEQINPFLRRLSGLVKNILSTQAGRVNLPRLASRLGQSEQLTLVGLYWLAARGFIQLEFPDVLQPIVEDRDFEQVSQIVLKKGGAPEPDQADFFEKQIQISLQEAWAFHSYYQRMDVHDLV